MNPLREAAVQLKLYAGVNCTHKNFDAINAVCDYVLSSVLDDDDEPVTMEWLDEIGRPFELGDSWHLCVYDGSPPHINYPLGRFEYESSPDLAPCPTRGHVRRLCRCLGIPLQEPTS